MHACAVLRIPVGSRTMRSRSGLPAIGMEHGPVKRGLDYCIRPSLSLEFAFASKGSSTWLRSLHKLIRSRVYQSWDTYMQAEGRCLSAELVNYVVCHTVHGCVQTSSHCLADLHSGSHRCSAQQSRYSGAIEIFGFCDNAVPLWCTADFPGDCSFRSVARVL
jgi:hypothetical protein